MKGQRKRRATMVVLATCLLFFLGLTLGDETEKKDQKDEKGFVSLFNGKDLTGWVVMGSESWKVENGLLVCTGEGGGWLRSEKEYDDFVLRLEYKISKGGNSGIFLRAALHGNPAYTGMEIQILDDYGREPAHWTAGGMYDVMAPKKNMSKPSGEWNQVEIICSGPWVIVWMNGEEILRVSMDEHPKLKDRLRKGYIGLQNHGNRVEFRNIRIKPLKEKPDKA
ncbi:MAG: DUF1080 domain-containing protein [Armatimonadetes bacterium]|nr:DUF1080 domain-containing protein [Armatimonadota bacterium]MDW8120943.1 DUF1080 domain-containing protein [Armatimonadota bacterium]